MKQRREARAWQRHGFGRIGQCYSNASKELQKKGSEEVPCAVGFQVMAALVALPLSLQGAGHLLGVMLQPRLAFQALALVFRLISLRD